MRAFLNILLKDALQLWRTPVLVGLLVLCPLVTIGLVPFGLENKLALKVQVVDETYSEEGRKLLSQLNASPQITAVQALSIEFAQKRLESGAADAIVLISNDGEYEILADASHSLLAMDAAYYIGRQLYPFQDEEEDKIQSLLLFMSGTGNTHYYLTAMLVLLMAIIGCCLIGLSVINEKMNRQLEYFISVGMGIPTYVLSKLVFFSLVTLLELALGLVVGRIVFGFRVAGPLLDFFLLAACFLFCITNLGILMAAISRTLVQTIYSLIFVFFVLMLLGTMFAPVDNMSPFWASTRFVNPFFWMSDASWKIALKGFSLIDVGVNVLALLAQAALLTWINVRLLSKNGWS